MLKVIQRQHAQAVEEKTEDYENAVKRYESECISYKLARQDFLDAYTAWREVLFAHLQEEEAIREMLNWTKL